MASKQKTIYCCSNCGNETYNWAGKCPQCGDRQREEGETAEPRTEKPCAESGVERVHHRSPQDDSQGEAKVAGSLQRNVFFSRHNNVLLIFLF